jgi:Cysteine dioxygenase type I
VYAVPYLTVPAADFARPGGPTSIAMTLAAHPERWRPLLGYRTDTRWYRLLERTSQHEVWLLSWLPSQGTDLHDHGPASGAFAIAAGTLTERVVAATPGRPPVEVTHELVAGRCRAFGHRHCASGERARLRPGSDNHEPVPAGAAGPASRQPGTGRSGLVK